MKRAIEIIDGMSKLEGLKAYDSPNREKKKITHKIPRKKCPKKVVFKYELT